ncbi:MAG: hypothetical protein JWO94_1225 [Verrucomicrobiaceae bacterium]|nr:hypothetical protein [Verrucomicrobiaceae bacterium]
MTKTPLLSLAALFALAVSHVHAVGSAPSNDNFANALALTPGVSSSVDSTLATAQPGEPDHYTFGGARGATHSVWWKFTPAFSGYVQIDSRGSQYDTVLSVYTGTTLPSLHRVAQDDDSGSSAVPRTSLVIIPVIKGTVYHIAVDGISGDITGSTTVNLATLRINTPRTYQTALIGALQQEDNGLLTLVTTTSSLVTGKLQLGAHSYPFTGASDIDGHLVASVNRPGQQAALLDVTIGLASQGVVAGPVSGSVKVGGTITTIHAYPAALYTAASPCPRYALNRHYNYAIDTSGAVGYGAATVTVGATGLCTTSGTLGDGTAFVFTSPLLEDAGSSNGNIGSGGSYCYHLPLYATKGQITGVAAFDATDSPVSVTGNMQWFRPAPAANVAFLPQGINGSEFETFGNFYSPPQPAHRVDASFDISGGASTLKIDSLDFQAFSKSDLLLSTSNAFTYGATNLNLVKLAVVTNTGIVTGSVKLVSATPSGPTKISTLKGIVVHHPDHLAQFYGYATSTTGNAPLKLSANVSQ